jgi:outer membrane murein-binding lipoprotein Lpp
MTRIPTRRLLGAAVLAVAAVLVGCATPARIDQMQVDPSLATRSAAASSALKDNVAVKEVTGGQETNPMWMSNVSSSDFERALEASLRNAGLLSPNRQGSRYTLTAHMLKLEQPYFGASLTVTATVQYTLVERVSGKEVFARSLVTPYTAEFSAALFATERLKLANEGAARANIQQLIDALVALRLDGVEVGKP